jgi:hypothetical protein
MKLALIILLIVAFGLRGYFFLISTSYMPTTTDEAIAYFMARAIYHGERPLLFWGTPYQLPVESYLMSLFSPILPNTALGARAVLATLALCSLLGFYLLLRRMIPAREALVGMILIAIPSAYVLTLQSAYFIPQYTATLTYAWAIPLLASYTLSAPRAPGLLLLSLGALCGVALSNHLLSLPLVAVTLVAVGCGRNLRTAARNAAFLLPSFALGLVPYLFTAPQAAAAAASVTGSYPLSIAARRLFSDMMNHNLSTVLGFTVTLFPDLAQWPGRFPSLTPIALLLFWLLLGAVTVVGASQWVNRFRISKWPTFSVQDLVVGTVWATLCAYALSQRGKEGEYRYLLHVAWYTPILVALLFAATGGIVRRATLAIVFGGAIINIVHSSVLMKSWAKDGFSGGIRDILDISPVIHYLVLKKIDLTL